MKKLRRPEPLAVAALLALVVALPLSAAEEAKAAEPAKPAPAAPPTEAGAAAPATAAPAKPEWLRNRIRWSTASEVDNFGYDVFRSLEEKGTFTKVNAKPIPGHGTTDEPHSYEFYDDTIEPGIAYWYYVESISIDGEREIFTPIFQAKPKNPPAEPKKD